MPFIKIAVAAALSSLMLGAVAAPIEMSLGHTQPVNSPYDLTSHKFAEIVAQKSNGNIKVNVFPQSQLGGEVKMIQAARVGSLDMLITAQAVLGPTIKAYTIFDIPFLFDDIQQANRVLAGSIGREYLDMLPAYNLIGLDFLYAIERDIASSKPIRNAKDFHGLKLRVMQAPGYVKAYEQLGSQPTPMAYNEVYLSMQQGVVDGGDFSPESVTLDKFTEVSKYFNLTKTHYLPALLVFSKKKWDALTPADQKILQDASHETMVLAKGFYQQTYDQAMLDLKKSGMTIIDSDRADIKAAAIKANADLLKSIPDGQKRFDDIQKAKAMK